MHAAVGSVGLKAIEYAQWLGSSVMGTAGEPQKHWQLRSAGLEELCSLRDAPMFALGAGQLLAARRSHAVLSACRRHISVVRTAG